MKWGVLAAAALATACSSAPPRLPAAAVSPSASISSDAARARARLEARLPLADARLLEGCYDCLLDARTAYDEAASTDLRPRVVQRLFEANLLLALREKELALDAQSSLARARDLVPELGPAVDAKTALEIASAISPDDVGTPHRDRAAFLRTRASDLTRLDLWRERLRTSTIARPVQQYLSTSLDCEFPTASPGFNGVEAPMLVSLSADAPPLVAYRRAICPIVPEVLEAVRRSVPAFVETSYFLGRFSLQLVDARGPGLALGLLAEAHARFPRSPSVTYLTGALHQAVDAYDTAIQDYDETIALAALHENAWLGRVQSLTLVGRADEAIGAATTLIDMNERVTEALYWRARNWHATGQLARAREDIDRAKARSSRSPDVLTLAGIIEYDQRDLEVAERDLLAVRGMDLALRNCTARWYLGFVQEALSKSSEAGSTFAESGTCYESDVAASISRGAIIAANDSLDAGFKAACLAKLDHTIGEDRSQASASAYNAAVNYLRGGQKTKANEFADVAARDPERMAKVEELRRIIKQR